MDGYMLGWENFGQAWNIYWNPNANYGQRFVAGAYLGAWSLAHAAFIYGASEIILWQAGVACLQSTLCISLTGMAGGAGTNQLTSNQIGEQGAQQVGRNLPVQIGQFSVRNLITQQLRKYNGQFANGGFVEIKTSLSGATTYATNFIRNQVSFDATMGVKPTWIFVNSNPSKPLIELLSNAGIPWHVLHP
jgi:hypothetical protein